MLTVIAIGGNALASPGEDLRWERQTAAARSIAARIVGVLSRGHKVVITHGNGPQVGALLLQSEMAAGRVPQSPVDVCVALSQAHIGYALQLGLEEELRRKGIGLAVLPLVTMVIVDPEDPAFQAPSKPVGRLYAEGETGELEAAGWTLKEDARGGYRRVVPSPTPVEIVGGPFLRRLLTQDGFIPIIAGGGGIPVMRGLDGLRGVEAVIDKDAVSGLLASEIGAELLVIITDVPCVFLDYGKETQRPLGSITAAEAKAHMERGHFPRGSMGPKVQAAIDFVRGGGSRAIITNPEALESALNGKGGTSVVPESEPESRATERGRR